MADQDLQINIKTVADTTGIKLTEQQLAALQNAAKQGNQQAIAALKQLTDAANQAQSAFSRLSGVAGGLGGVLGGSLSALLAISIRNFKALEEEQNQMVETMIKTQAKMRELGKSIIDTQDKLIEQKRLGAEPLTQQYIDLQKTIIRLKTEMGLLSLPQQAEEWKNYNKEIAETENELNKVTRALQDQAGKGGPTTAEPTEPWPVAGKGESQAMVDEIERNRRAFRESQKQDIWEYDPETGGYKPSGHKMYPPFTAPPPPPPAPEPPSGPGKTPDKPLTLDLIRQAFEQGMAKYWGP